MIAVAAGDSLEAARFGEKANHLLDETALGLLLQAQTAQLAGEGKNARASFEALRQRPDTEFLGLRGLIAYAARDGDSARALDYARRAYALKPDVAWVARELMLQEAAHGYWQNALQVLDRARRRSYRACDRISRRGPNGCRDLRSHRRCRFIVLVST